MSEETVVMKGERATYRRVDLDFLATGLMEKLKINGDWLNWEVEIADAGALLRVYYDDNGIKTANIAL